jgi:signal transduction histidine kinase
MPYWYRSLYWRIAIGFVLGLASMLVVQAVLFVWLVSRSGPTLPGEPDRFAQTVAVDVGQALAADPRVDLASYLADQYARDAHPFYVLLADGRTFSNSPTPIPETVHRMARASLGRGSIRGAERNEGRGRFGRGEPPFRAGGGERGPRPPRPVPIIVNGEMVGVVAVLPRAPFPFLLRRYAPTLAIVAVSVLLGGATLASIAIFGPPRRRLRAVESAARRLGTGDLSARAPTTGGDEVAAVATAFNTMADDLAARAAALAAVDRARRQLLADVSHELTTPVTAMRGYLDTLTMPEFQLDDQTRARYLQIISDETGRLERILGDLLELARLEGGGGELTLADVPVDQLFARVAARHERASAETGVSIEAIVEDGTPTIQGDRDRLEQALQNLAANALRYAPRGTAVELRGRRQGGMVVVTVTDRGPGISPEHLPHVFDRFYKAEPSRSPRSGGVSGSGLGLSIAKAIVERHGGTIAVTSEPGRTSFQITLPQACAAPRPAGAS